MWWSHICYMWTHVYSRISQFRSFHSPTVWETHSLHGHHRSCSPQPRISLLKMISVATIFTVNQSCRWFHVSPSRPSRDLHQLVQILLWRTITPAVLLHSRVVRNLFGCSGSSLKDFHLRDELHRERSSHSRDQLCRNTMKDIHIYIVITSPALLSIDAVANSSQLLLFLLLLLLLTDRVDLNQAAVGAPPK